MKIKSVRISSVSSLSVPPSSPPLSAAGLIIECFGDRLRCRPNDERTITVRRHHSLRILTLLKGHYLTSVYCIQMNTDDSELQTKLFRQTKETCQQDREILNIWFYSTHIHHKDWIEVHANISVLCFLLCSP